MPTYMDTVRSKLEDAPASRDAPTGVHRAHFRFMSPKYSYTLSFRRRRHNIHITIPQTFFVLRSQSSYFYYEPICFCIHYEISLNTSAGAVEAKPSDTIPEVMKPTSVPDIPPAPSAFGLIGKFSPEAEFRATNSLLGQ